MQNSERKAFSLHKFILENQYRHNRELLHNKPALGLTSSSSINQLVISSYWTCTIIDFRSGFKCEAKRMLFLDLHNCPCLLVAWSIAFATWLWADTYKSSRFDVRDCTGIQIYKQTTACM